MKRRRLEKSTVCIFRTVSCTIINIKLHILAELVQFFMSSALSVQWSAEDRVRGGQQCHSTLTHDLETPFQSRMENGLPLSGSSWEVATRTHALHYPSKKKRFKVPISFPQSQNGFRKQLYDNDN